MRNEVCSTFKKTFEGNPFISTLVQDRELGANRNHTNVKEEK